MSTSRSLSVGLLFLTAVISGCGPLGKSPPETLYDFGPVFAHETPALTHRFSLENTTGRTVKILDEWHSCACTKVEFDKKTLGPGESALLTMTVEVPPDYSNLELRVKVQTDHPDFPDWTYRLRLESFPRVRVEPNRIDLGTRRPGRETPRTPESADSFLEVYGSARKPLPVPDLRSFHEPSGLSVELSSLRIEPVARGVVRARYALKFSWRNAPFKEAGAQSQPVTFTLSDGSSCSAGIHWTDKPYMEARPAIVHFGTSSTEDRRRDIQVHLRATDGKPFSIIAIESESSCVRGGTSEPLPTSPASDHVVTLTFRPGPDTDRHTLAGTVLIRSDRSGDTGTVIPWSVFLKPTAGSSTITTLHTP